MSDSAYLIVTADIPSSVRQQLCTDLNEVHLWPELSEFNVKAAEGPSFIQLVAEVFQWITPLRAAATIFLGQLAKNAADDVWKHKHEIASALKKTAVAPLQKLVTAVSRLRTSMGPETNIYIGLPVPDQFWCTRLSVATRDEAETAWQLANFINQADEIEKAVQRLLADGHKPPGLVELVLDENRAFRLRWLEMDGEQYEVQVPFDDEHP